ncbi:MarR family winged helix-turn-helix transcriptional regulator [Agromyces sp. SYSU T00194]|uniref:MarR family winged helix-turn-helix transcriptional regulator n=1 Tax=Agromyces chitinivorans TaxID=3158560 RepID=UPI003391C1DE
MPRPHATQLASIDAVDRSPVAPTDPDDLLGILERMIRQANSSRLRRAIMAEVGFPVDDIPTFLALNQLSLHGAMRPTDLAEGLETGRANVTKIVARLAGVGLVERVADPADARGVIIALTPAGRALAARVVAVQERTIAETLAGWPAADVDAFRALTRRWVEGWGA